VSPGSVAVGVVLEALILALAAYTAVKVACALLPTGADLLDRTAVAAMVGICGWVALLLVLGLVGALWLPAVIIGLGVAAVACRVALPPLPALPVPRWAWSPGASLALISVAALAVCLTVSGHTFDYDSVHYHIVNAAHYLDTGSIRTVPFSDPGDDVAASPGDGALLLLAVMLPFHTAGASSLVALFATLVLVVLAASLSRELGRGAWAGAVAALVVVSTYVYFVYDIGTAQDTGVGLVGLASAITFGLRAARTGQLRWLLLAGMGAGLAIGTKAADLLPGMAVAVAVVIIDRSWRRPLGLAGLAAAVAALSLPWYLRNWVDLGNPLFPIAVQLGPWHVFSGFAGDMYARADVQQSVVSGLLNGAGGSPGSWFTNAFGAFGLVLPALPLGIIAGRWARGRGRWIAVLSAACVACYLVTPYSGSANVLLVEGSMRFLLPAGFFAVMTLAVAAPVRWTRLGAAAVLTANLLAVAVYEAQHSPGAVLGAALITMVALALIGLRHRIHGAAGWLATHRAAYLTLGGALVLLATAVLQPPPAPSPVESALEASGNPEAPVVVVNAGNVASILGPSLDVNIVSVGDGPPGPQAPINSPTELTERIEAVHPAAVVIQYGNTLMTLPSGWAPPAGWRVVGEQGGATVYAT